MAASPLRTALAKWDNKDAASIRQIYDQHSSRRNFVATITRLAAIPDFERAASWLLKHHLDSGGTCSHAQAREFFARARDFEHWEARLHMLQIMDLVVLPKESVRDIKRLVERCMADENKFVRAWAYNGFARLAYFHPAYREEAERLLADGEATETAPSVRARIRQVRKRGFRTKAAD
ncbi:MAG: hypothetical protein KF757_00735 [Phycisphaeraceae bacterium]|nr:hypothetical protein [Phycisphaeraceae bacterium]MCW5761733.1 hypothetical protein [Phycisphaeraceae bacterium]